MGISVQHSNGTVKVIIDETFAIEEASIFKKEIYELCKKGEKNFVVDFAKCNFIDSTGLGILVSVYKKCAEQNGNITLCSINNSKVLKVFQLTRLDKVFEILPTCP